MKFRERLKSGERLVGTLLTLDAPEVAEILSRAGYDWLFLDLEHSAMGPSEAQRLLQAVDDRVPTLARVESRDEAGIRKALDIGAAGIIVPQIHSRAEAETAVALAKYPPAGIRGIGLGRAALFGNHFADYVARANQETVVVVQIEHVDAVADIAAIAAVEGVDALFVGPYDLSASMGMPGEVAAPEVADAIAKVLAAARSAHLAAGIFAASATVARRYAVQGFSLIAMGADGLLLGQAAASELRLLDK
ncbi:MAG: aldolase/citrate lyase family protein [Desulfobacteraceae bacterium]|jgi:2-keto-3-deoxy-L-rhamnonate aldolase RhmA|nr:aldolase/citrate lyase family protein [Desulfobacteraceae bacterium]